ncbi:glycoside hydrolase family 3 N-terminal domain-containing protein [Flavobacterium sp. GSB-24]|uniref:glycoside hydrolase family 3 N-terminal domain-containing protein n=1 Tax=Flavobacterium sp. GSB-24 TaxID=2994319 RepID=UPI00248F9CD7|nr:glycoside hydrolase family 3 N-terminal domain-containing protein [Flavobacterium sp. GSB-24]BDU25780.1 beta-glucosidase [Flavobacterium sp. GSB-24]
MRPTIIQTMVVIFTLNLVSGQVPLYKDKSVKVQERVADLVKRMTFEEKVLQLNQYTFGLNSNPNNIGPEIKKLPAGIGSLIYFSADPVLRNAVQKKAMEETRLGIPVLFGFDVIHGFRTVYPISIAQACSWNPELVKLNCAEAARESVLSGVDWTFSPMIDVARDPRWGRVSEGYGEDPYVNAVFGAASVRGYQGAKLSDPFSIAACLKHYVGYGMSEGGRDYRFSDVSPQSLWETYLPPYKACIDAGAATVMSGFNDISGVPATSNYYTLTEILKNRWKFEGFVLSDWNAVEQLTYQGVAKDKKEAAQKAFMAGVEMDMKDNIYLENFTALLAEKKITIKAIDEAVGRVLKVKFELGLFDNPYTEIIDENLRYLQPQSKQLAANLAAESMVLLKNNNNILPLKNETKKIALIGPMAKDKENIIGSWSFNGQAKDAESIFEGIANEFKNVSVNYAKGCDFDGSDEQGFAEALSIAQQSDVIVLCLGEKKTWSGENASRSTIALPEIQEKLAQALQKTGKPIVLVLSSGRPLELARLEKTAAAVIEIWQPGIEGGTPLAGILSGRLNPSGKLAITFPLTTGQIPVYYGMRQSARPFDKQGDYQDISTQPLYNFGHGLSYTDYKYSPVESSAVKVSKKQKIKFQVIISNEGKYDGKETVLWYVSDPVASISRPLKELKFFEKKEIKSGQKTVYTYEIDPIRDLSFPDSDGKLLFEPGEFYLYANDQKIKFEVTE